VERSFRLNNVRGFSQLAEKSLDGLDAATKGRIVEMLRLLSNNPLLCPTKRSRTGIRLIVFESAITKSFLFCQRERSVF